MEALDASVLKGGEVLSPGPKLIRERRPRPAKLLRESLAHLLLHRREAQPQLLLGSALQLRSLAPETIDLPPALLHLPAEAASGPGHGVRPAAHDHLRLLEVLRPLPLQLPLRPPQELREASPRGAGGAEHLLPCCSSGLRQLPPAAGLPLSQLVELLTHLPIALTTLCLQLGEPVDDLVDVASCFHS